MELQIKTVKELTNEIKNTLEGQFPYIWVKGEVGPVKLHSSGHRYFSLKEDDYVINAICWKGTPISANLEEGAIVECYAKITIFGARSSYQLIAKEIREVSKQGNIFFQLEELKKKLIQEGVFDLKNSDNIKKFPEKIAILTSPTGAVLHDMLNRITARFPCVEILFFPISVQGSESKLSILNALKKLENFNQDTVILARGGGSLEDLWIFNDEDIVRAVAHLKFPIISAIGHETDTTLVDYAANLRAPTPTAAAELSVPDKFELKNVLDMLMIASVNYSNEKIKNIQNFLKQFEDHKTLFKNSIESFLQRIDNYILNFVNNSKNTMKKYEIILSQKVSLSHLFNNFKLEILNHEQNILNIVNLRMNEIRSKFSSDFLLMKEKESELKGKVIISSKKKRLFSAKEIESLNKEEFTLSFFDGNVLVKQS